MKEALLKETPNGLHLRKAVLSIEKGTAKESGFNLNLVVFTIEHKSKKGITDTVTMTFGDKQLEALGFVESSSLPPLDEAFKNLLTDAVTTSAPIVSLPLSEITVKKEFAISKDTKGGLSFKVAAYGGEAGGGLTIDWNKTSKNAIELTYSK